MTDRIVNTVAKNVNEDEDLVSAIIDEFCLQLNKQITEHPQNRDFVGGSLWTQIPPQAFFHFLGFLDAFSGRYDWENGTANEYLARLGKTTDWLPFAHQERGWKRNQMEE